LRAFSNQSGINDFGISVATKRAVHN